MAITIITRAEGYANNRAIVDGTGSYSYAQLLRQSELLAKALLNSLNTNDLNEARVCFLCPSGFSYVVAQWAIWRAGGVAVPLCTAHPINEMAYVLTDSQASILLVDDGLTVQKDLQLLAEQMAVVYITVDAQGSTKQIDTNRSLPSVDEVRRAMILYTSGTTGKPKGVVTTHQIIAAQISSLVLAWQWTSNDYILHVLPLHHTHGIINKLCCALWSGATCDMLPKFTAERVWACFVERPLTLFMAVPTIYNRLIAAYEQKSAAEQAVLSNACRKMRLMVSGSAALPIRTLKQWQGISRHILLERYGMTEIGMALSNSYTGERLPGKVGRTLPNVVAQVVNENFEPIAEGEQGQLQIKGPGVFLAYWNRPEATEAAFVNGWFCTGDIVKVTNGVYQIVGRNSVDIIKTGGYKVSALEIEEVLREQANVEACAVVGLPDPEWGECVAAAIVVAEQPNEVEAFFQTLKLACKTALAPYKIPRKFILLTDLPRNVLGKVLKPTLKKYDW